MWILERSIFIAQKPYFSLSFFRQVLVFRERILYLVLARPTPHSSFDILICILLQLWQIYVEPRPCWQPEDVSCWPLEFFLSNFCNAGHFRSIFDSHEYYIFQTSASFRHRSGGIWFCWQQSHFCFLPLCQSKSFIQSCRGYLCTLQYYFILYRQLIFYKIIHHVADSIITLLQSLYLLFISSSTTNCAILFEYLSSKVKNIHHFAQIFILGNFNAHHQF